MFFLASATVMPLTSFGLWSIAGAQQSTRGGAALGRQEFDLLRQGQEGGNVAMELFH